MKKLCVFCTLFFLCNINALFAQETANREPGTFFLTAGPNILLNFDDSFQSAPSPVMFSGGFGAHIPIIDSLDFSPHVAFFTNYYLLSGEVAYPAEIEHRTALVPSFMIALPIDFKIPVGKSLFTVGAGISVLARYGFLATGVPDSEKEDIDEINSYLWGGARWLYPIIQGGWDYVLPNGMAAGVLVRAYFPLGSFIDPNPSAFQSMIISASLRFHLSTRLF